MQGTGNDFIVIDNRENPVTIEQIVEWAPKMCDRRFGIGADGIILFHNATDPALDYTMTYRNADGSNAGMCGNGARCLALFAHSLGLGSEFSFNVHNNIYEAEILPENHVRISFPMKTEIDKLTIDGQVLYQSYPGTEHITLPVEKDDLGNEEKLISLGRKLRHEDKFNPPGTNVNFIYGEDAENVHLQTYERGVENLTLACGTGAIASALTWHYLQEEKNSESSIKVHVKGGELKVDFSFQEHNNSYHNIKLSGSAEQVFSGEYNV